MDGCEDEGDGSFDCLYDAPAMHGGSSDDDEKEGLLMFQVDVLDKPQMGRRRSMQAADSLGLSLSLFLPAVCRVLGSGKVALGP
jgi:hypothetical protein